MRKIVYTPNKIILKNYFIPLKSKMKATDANAM
jgi:hypothetical protein